MNKWTWLEENNVACTVGTMLSVNGATFDNKLWKKHPIGKNRDNTNSWDMSMNTMNPSKTREKKHSYVVTKKDREPFMA